MELPHRTEAVQNWEDEDLKAVLEELSKGLADNIQLLSSWEKYRKEVRSLPAGSFASCGFGAVYELSPCPACPASASLSALV